MRADRTGGHGVVIEGRESQEVPGEARADQTILRNQTAQIDLELLQTGIQSSPQRGKVPLEQEDLGGKVFGSRSNLTDRHGEDRVERGTFLLAKAAQALEQGQAAAVEGDHGAEP